MDNAGRVLAAFHAALDLEGADPGVEQRRQVLNRTDILQAHQISPLQFLTSAKRHPRRHFSLVNELLSGAAAAFSRCFSSPAGAVTRSALSPAVPPAL